MSNGAIIHYGAQLRGHQFAHMAAEYRRPATVKVTFQAVTDGFMQQDARPARAQHNRQHPGRRRDGGQVDQRHTHGFSRPNIRANVAILRVQEIVVAKAAAAAAGAALAFAILFHQHADGKANQRANVRRQRAVGGGDKN